MLHLLSSLARASAAALNGSLRLMYMLMVAGPAGQQQQQGHKGAACQLVLVTSLDQSESD